MVLPAGTVACTTNFDKSWSDKSCGSTYIDSCFNKTSFDLVAGQTNDIGDVFITKAADGGIVVDVYVTKDGYYMTSAEVAWGKTEDGLPHSNGGLTPGKFKYKLANLVYSNHVTFTIPASDLSGIAAGTKLLVAVHASISSGGATYETFKSSITDSTTFTLVNPSADGNSYFGVTINGVTYRGWCIDTSRQTQGAPTEYKFNTYSSTDSLPAGLINNSENMPFVNWIINQNYVGKTASDGTPYTYGDVQMAIWYFMDDNPSPTGTGTFTQAHVNAITAAASAHSDYVPAPGSKVAVIIKPTKVIVNGVEYSLYDPPISMCNWGQIMIIELETKKGCSETAWAAVKTSCGGYGHDYPGSSWSKYVHFYYGTATNTGGSGCNDGGSGSNNGGSGCHDGGSRGKNSGSGSNNRGSGSYNGGSGCGSR